MLKVKFVDYPKCDVIDITLNILKEEFGEVQVCDDPDFLFYSVFGHEHLKYDCVRIFWTGENIQPDFNICDYAIGFSNIIFEDRYKRVPLYYFYLEDYKKAKRKHLLTSEDLEKKTKFCNFIYSNGAASNEREEFFDLLNSYKIVDSGGKFRNNIGGPVKDKYEFQKEYKFSIAFENSTTIGYTTEKILQAFSAGTIPIYWGNPEVGKEFNEKAFINCHNYKDFSEVVELIKEIDSNDKIFKSYLQESIGNELQCPEDGLKEYRDYIIYICRQNPKDAIRRSNILRGQWYQEDMRNAFYPPQSKNTKNIYRKIKKILFILRKKFKNI